MKIGHPLSLPIVVLMSTFRSSSAALTQFQSGWGDGIRIGVIYIQRQTWPRDLPHERLLAWQCFNGPMYQSPNEKYLTFIVLCSQDDELYLSLYQAFLPSLHKSRCRLSPLCCCFLTGEMMPANCKQQYHAISSLRLLAMFVAWIFVPVFVGTSNGSGVIHPCFYFLLFMASYWLSNLKRFKPTDVDCFFRILLSKKGSGAMIVLASILLVFPIWLLSFGVNTSVLCLSFPFYRSTGNLSELSNQNVFQFANHSENLLVKTVKSHLDPNVAFRSGAEDRKSVV